MYTIIHISIYLYKKTEFSFIFLRPLVLFCTLLCALFSLSLSLPRSVSRAISDHCCYTVPMLLLILCVLSTRFFSFFLFYYFILYIFCCMFICYRIVFFLFRYCCCCSWLLLLLLEKRGWKAHGSSKCWALTLCVWVYLWMHAIFNRRSFVCSFVNLFSCAIVRLCVYTCCDVVVVLMRRNVLQLFRR